MNAQREKKTSAQVKRDEANKKKTYTPKARGKKAQKTRKPAIKTRVNAVILKPDEEKSYADIL